MTDSVISRCLVSIARIFHGLLRNSSMPGAVGPYWCVYVLCLYASALVAWWHWAVAVNEVPRSTQPTHSLRCRVAAFGKPLSHICAGHKAALCGTGQKTVLVCSQEGNRKSGVALVILYRPCCMSTYLLDSEMKILWIIESCSQRLDCYKIYIVKNCRTYTNAITVLRLVWK